MEFRWKEEVIYWEGERGFAFDGAWGHDPLSTYVPTVAAWDNCVPPWMRGRRDVIVERLRAEAGHVVEDDPGFQAYPERELQR